MKQLKNLLFLLILTLPLGTAIAMAPPLCPDAGKVKAAPLDIVEYEGDTFMVSTSGYKYLDGYNPWTIAIGKITAQTWQDALAFAKSSLLSISIPTTHAAFATKFGEQTWWVCRYPTNNYGLAVSVATPDSGYSFSSIDTKQLISA